MINYIFASAEFSKMKDELPDSFKKGLESANEKEDPQKTTPTPDKDTTPSEQAAHETKTPPTEEKEKVSDALKCIAKGC